jgi:hypothetical protein
VALSGLPPESLGDGVADGCTGAPAAADGWPAAPYCGIAGGADGGVAVMITGGADGALGLGGIAGIAGAPANSAADCSRCCSTPTCSAIDRTSDNRTFTC